MVYGSQCGRAGRDRGPGGGIFRRWEESWDGPGESSRSDLAVNLLVSCESLSLSVSPSRVGCKPQSAICNPLLHFSMPPPFSSFSLSPLLLVCVFSVNGALVQFAAPREPLRASNFPSA